MSDRNSPAPTQPTFSSDSVQSLSSPQSAFPRTTTKSGAGDRFDENTTTGSRMRRTSSADNDFVQAATIPVTKSAAQSTTMIEGRGRSKSRSQHSTKFAPLAAASTSAAASHQLNVHTGASCNSSSSEMTIVELQQRLELMTREKMTLESAIEQEQERVFNQNRRMSGTLSPAALVPAAGVGIGIGAGAISPRWATSHSRSSSVSSFGATSVSSVGITETLKADVNSLRLRLADTERELVSCYNQSQIYKKELVSLRQRLGMGVDDLYMDDPVPISIRPVLSDHTARPRRSQSVSSGVSSTVSTPVLVRRGSGHHHEYFGLLPATASGALSAGTSSAAIGSGSGTGSAAAPRRISQRPHSVLLSPRRSMEDHHAPAADSVSLFATKSAAGPPQRASRGFK